MPIAAERDWALFADWCASVEVKLEVPWFTGGRPAPIAGLDAAHVALGLAVPSRRITSPASRFDQTLVDVTLGRIPVGGWPAGIVGRRDAALVALICVGRSTRRQARALPAAPGRAPVLSPAVEPGACPECAMSRWLRVHALAAAADWRAVRAELANIGEVPARQETAHDCTRPVRWPNRQAGWPMFSAIDRHGRVNEAVPLSIRSIPTVVARRLDEGERRSHSPVEGDLPDSPPNVQAVSPSGNHQSGLRARQEANRRLAELESIIDAADAYAEAILERLDFPECR